MGACFLKSDIRLQIIIVLFTVSTLFVFTACGSDSQTSVESGSSSTVLTSPPEFPEAVDSNLAEVKPTEVPEELKVIWEAWQLLVSDYVDQDKLDPEAVSESAIRGMLSVLQDPQTSYVPPETMSGGYQDMLHGEFEGIGAHVSQNLSGKILIVAPIEGSPAEQAGLKPGDIIMAADGDSMEGLSLLGAVTMIRGPKGTIVTLLIKRLGVVDPFEVQVTRGLIPLTSVYLRSKPEDRYAHIRISQFYPNTVDALRETIMSVTDNGAKGLILDIRDNPGGTLSSVVDVASQFLEDGLVLYVVTGDGKKTDWEVRGGGIAKEIPLVVLVNEFSASSSEVLAGALQDHKRAEIIGTTSYGKGSVNWLRNLSNGGGLYITIARWFTPLGRMIHEQGIEPDIKIDLRDDRETDVKQLQCAIQTLDEITGMAVAKDVCSS